MIEFTSEKTTELSILKVHSTINSTIDLYAVKWILFFAKRNQNAIIYGVCMSSLELFQSETSKFLKVNFSLNFYPKEQDAHQFLSITSYFNNWSQWSIAKRTKSKNRMEVTEFPVRLSQPCSEGNTRNVSEVFVSQVFQEHWLLPLKNLQNHPPFQFACLSLVWVMTSFARFAIPCIRCACRESWLLYSSSWTGCLFW